MFKSIRRYWNLYGGWIELFVSPYLFVAFVLNCFSYPLWFNPKDIIWPDMSINILPSLMGFSVAGMTVLLAFSHPRSLKAITDKSEQESYFVKTFANLFHFLMVQTTALVLAILAKSFSFTLLSYFGVLALIYAVLVSLAVAGQLFNTARIINKAAAISDDSEKN